MRRGWRTRAGRTGPQGRHAGGHQRRLHGDGVRGPDDARDDDGPRLEQLLRGVDRRAAGAPASPAGGGGAGVGCTVGRILSAKESTGVRNGSGAEPCEAQ